MCGTFAVGRVLYTLGYKSGNPASVRESALQLFFFWLTETPSEYLALSSEICQ